MTLNWAGAIVGARRSSGVSHWGCVGWGKQGMLLTSHNAQGGPHNKSLSGPICQ